MMDLPKKPLGGRAYGSTPHLSRSRMGPGDWHIHEGQERILTVRARDHHDRIIVTEKLDGSCCAVARIGDDVLALTRAGYLASSSPYEQHHHFAAWVGARRWLFLGLLRDGERIVGEWLLQAHGTRYELRCADELFVPFGIFEGKHRVSHDELTHRVSQHLRPATVLSDGPPLSVEEAMLRIREFGWHGATDPVEGVVWVCERKGAFDFTAKYVRIDKQDGCLLPEMTGAGPVWNFQPDRLAA